MRRFRVKRFRYRGYDCQVERAFSEGDWLSVVYGGEEDYFYDMSSLPSPPTLRNAIRGAKDMVNRELR